MQFLRTIFWVILAVAVAVFALGNWKMVTIDLWGDVQIDAKLPFLMFITFLIGFLPMLILYRATRWRLRKKLETSERALAEARGPVVAIEPVESLPPIAAPVAVPPGVA